MDLQTLDELILIQSSYGMPFPVTDAFDLYGYISVNGKTVFPVEHLSEKYSLSEEVIIRNAAGTEIGTLSILKNKTKDVASLTEYQFAALLVDAPGIVDIAVTTHLFSMSYAVVDNDYAISYIQDYKDSAPLWGMFSHPNPSLVFPFLTPSVINHIDAFSSEKFQNNVYREAAIRGFLLPFSFERFLKYYHMLELNFDYDLIRRMKALDTDRNASDISKLLNEYNQADIERLEYLFMTYCTDMSEIEQSLNIVMNFADKAEEIFFKYGKKGNPLRLDQFQAFRLLTNPFSHPHVRATMGSSITSTDQYRKFLCKLTIYFIYRIRCSIAHNKIGEYVMTQNDEQFVRDFGERLLLSFVRGVYK